MKIAVYNTGEKVNLSTNILQWKLSSYCPELYNIAHSYS